MLCLQLSVAGTLNGSIGGRGARAGPGCPLSSGQAAERLERRRGNPGADPAQQRRPAEERRRQSAESGSLTGPLSPADLRRISAGGQETRASQSPARPSSAEFSDYDTAVCSEFSESFSDCAETPPQASHNDQQGGGGEEGSASGAIALHPAFGRQLGRKDGGAPLILTRSSDSDSCDVLPWENFLPCAGDEAHFITTHEIQLYELDHDGDGEFAVGASWDVAESRAAPSYMDTSSLDSEGSEEGSQTPQGTSCASVAPAGEAPSPGMAGGRLAEEPGSCAGHIHLSISASSRAVSERGKGQEKGPEPVGGAEQPWRGNGASLPEPPPAGDSANGAIPGDKCTVPANVGGKANRKGIEFSSSASSAVSELDDADKEVRTLTARAFRSLACPEDEYLDTYCAGGRSSAGLSSLSEGSIALNRWAAYVDLQCRNAMEKKDPREFPTRNAKASIAPETGVAPKTSAGTPGIRDPPHPSSPPLPPSPLNARRENPAEKQTFSKIQLTGKFEQIGSRVITLTETLNFSYDVKEQLPARPEGGRRLELARNAGGSRCADAAKEPAPKEEGSGIGRGASTTAQAMEGAHKKSKFASNLLQSVIWKKMQFEQELRMERGEISDTSFAGRSSPPAAAAIEFPKTAPRAGEPPRDLQRPNSSRISGGSPRTSPEPCPEVSVSAEPAGASSDQELVQAVTCDAAGGANPSKGGLLRSQHSAFRSWKDSGLEMQKSGESLQPSEESQHRGQRVRAEIGGQAQCKETKMSHLFVPSIQKLAKETDPAATDLVLNVKYTTQPQEGAPCQMGDSTSNLANSRSPEIKIKLRSLKDSKHSPFSVAKLLAPNIGSNAAAGTSADEPRCHAISTSLASDNPEDNRARVPQFTVRDIRDSIHKQQVPIHQVRDVRKLVKSSYHILTLDGNHLQPLQSSEHVPTKQASSLLPIVIKCQSVSRKDPASARHSRLAECAPDQGVSKDGGVPGPESGGMQNGSAFVHRASGRIPLKEVAPACAPGARANASPPAVAAATGAEKLGAGRQVASKQLALEKLTAAVKTMEQLYVFDKNEWKRKSEPGPGPLAGSHVLSLIASEEASCSCTLEGEGARASGQDSIWNVRLEPAPRQDSIRNVGLEPAAGQDSIRSGQTRCKSVGSEGISAPLFTVAPVAPQPSSFNLSAKVMGSSRKVGLAVAQSPQLPDFRPLRAQRCKPWEESEMQSKPDSATQAEHQQPLPSEYENYLTIPVKKPVAVATREPPLPPPPAIYALPPMGAVRVPGSSPKLQCQARVPSPATIYHRPQPQLLCFSPPTQPPEQLVAAKMHPPQPVLMDACFPLPQTQRKMLLDPTTGQCYLVDTPVQPARKRLFDPETGQYVEVPLPQQQPLSVPMSPIAINPGTYGTTYMLYPGFLPPPALLPTQLSRTESEGSEAEKTNSALSQQAYMESPYYSPTGKSLNPAQTLSSQHRPAKGFLEGKPVISFTSQQGPRIIAPPSFDGTTMSFVVEHR